MGRGSGETQTARNLLYGPRRRGSGIDRTFKLDSLIEEIGSGQGPFFSRLGLTVKDNRHEEIFYGRDKDIPDSYRQGQHCDIYQGGNKLCSLEHYRERGPEGERHIFAIEKRAELGPPQGALDRLGQEIGALSGDDDKFFEINIKQFDDFNQDWIDEIKAGQWSLADSEMNFPSKSEAEMIRETVKTFHFPTPAKQSKAETLAELAEEKGGVKFIEERVAGGFVYLRKRLG